MKSPMKFVFDMETADPDDVIAAAVAITSHYCNHYQCGTLSSQKW